MSSDQPDQYCVRCSRLMPSLDDPEFELWEAYGAEGEAVLCPDCTAPAEQRRIDEDWMALDDEIHIEEAVNEVFGESPRD